MNTINSPAHNEIKRAITFYEKNGYDWMNIVEFLARKANGSLHEVIRTNIGVGLGRPRSAMLAADYKKEK